MKYKIIKYSIKNNEFMAINLENNNLIGVDPYVGCAYEGEPRDLIGKVFETKDEHYFRPLLMPNEGDFKEVKNE